MTGPIPRHRVAWRLVGKGSNRHAVLKIERGRLAWDTLCGRPTAQSRPAQSQPECGKCVGLLEPVVEWAAA